MYTKMIPIPLMVWVKPICVVPTNIFFVVSELTSILLDAVDSYFHHMHLPLKLELIFVDDDSGQQNPK